MEEIKNVADLIAEARRENTPKERLQELASLSDKLAEAVAQNIAAPPDLLGKLAHYDSKAVRKAIAGNPNTPIIKLFVIGDYFPRELLNNPIFSRLTLEDLKSVEHIASDTLASLIQQPQVPEFLLNYAANHQDKIIAYMAKMNVAISGEMSEGWHEEAAIIIRETPIKYDILDNYFNEEEFNKVFIYSELLTNFLEFIPPVILENLEFRNNLGKNPNTTKTWLRQLGHDPTRWIRNSVAGNPNTPLDILELLSRDRNYMVRRDVIGNPNTTVEIIESLAEDPSESVRMWVAQNTKTTTNKLAILASDSSERVRMWVAGNPNTPKDKLKILANDDNFQVSELVAKNPNTPVKILESFAKDPSKSKRRYLAENIGLTPSILELLANDSDRWVRYRVAENPSTPVSILDLLANDPDTVVINGVAKNSSTPLRILEFLAADSSNSNLIHQYLAENPSSSAKILNFLSTNSSPAVRENVAKNPSTTQDILQSLANDSIDSVRRSIAENPSASSNILKNLANDSDIEVRFFVAKNHNTPISILEQLANDRDDLVRGSVSANPKCTYEIKKLIFKNFAKFETPSLSRLALLFSDYAASFVLTEHSDSISWLERYAIAQNQNTLRDTLEILAQDSNRIVRATAKESLEKLSSY
ncbi:MAG: HEAT repeat domain-containing protein [Cyanobacteria bacterium P01_F01_bin.143]